MGWLALTVAMLAGMSQLIGDSVVLLFNRVRPARLVGGMVLNGVLHIFGVVAQAASLWMVATLAFNAHQPFSLTVLIVCLGSAPLLFGFLVLAATLGPYVAAVLRAWSWLIVLLALRDGFRLSLWHAFLCLALGRVLLDVAGMVLGRPLHWATARVWRWVTGATAGVGWHDRALLRTGELQRSTVLDLGSALGLQLLGRRS